MSIISILTPQDFKNQFPKGFNYLPIWISTNVYNQGQEIYYAINGLFYTCLNNNVTSTPVTTSDWQITQDNINNYVTDQDITNAYMIAQNTFNINLPFGNDVNIINAYLYLTAHYLVISGQNQGMASGGTAGIVNTQSVGNVSQGFTIPQKFLDNLLFASWQSTPYGRIYIQLIYPFTIGNMVSIYGGSVA